MVDRAQNFSEIQMMNMNARMETIVKSDKIKAKCNQCVNDTWHEVLHVEERKWDCGEEDYYTYGFDTYILASCLGCESIHLQHVIRTSEAKDYEDNLIPSKLYYPSRISRHKPDWLLRWDTNRHLTYDTKRLLTEIYVTLESGSRQIAVIGIRALLEHIMILKVGENGSIERNVKAFFDRGYISELDRDVFRMILIEAGHAAMHRLYVPSDADLSSLMDLLESVIFLVFIHPVKAQEISNTIPPRPPKQNN